MENAAWLTPGGVSLPLDVMTKEHRWTIGSIEDLVAHIEVDGRQTMHVPKWMLPRGARFEFLPLTANNVAAGQAPRRN